jgi:hypothetical protein
MSQDGSGDGSLDAPAARLTAEQPAGGPTGFGEPFEAPWQYGQQPLPPNRRRRLPGWAIAAIGVPVAMIAIVLAAVTLPSYLDKRNTPVMPAQLSGLSTSTDSQLLLVVSTMRKELAQSNKVVETRVAGYGTVSSGYVLIGFNARVDANKEFTDMGATIPPLTIGEESCAPSATEKVSMCVRSSPRGSVAVAAFRDIDLHRLAAITDEAWSDQPFG